MESIICPICKKLIHYQDINGYETRHLVIDVCTVEYLCPNCNKPILFHEEKGLDFSTDYGWRQGAKSIKMYCYDKTKGEYIRCNSYTFDFKNKSISYSTIREY